MGELEVTERQIRPVARNQKRRLLRQLNVRASDLDTFAAVHVDLLARSLSKIALIDDHYASRGQVVDADGQPAASLPIYVALLNSARLTAAKLAEHMYRKGTSAPSLQDYIDNRYSVRDGDDN